MFEVEFRPRRRSDIRSERCSHLFLLWSTIIAVIIVSFVLLNYKWATIITVIAVISLIWFTWYYFHSAPPETEPVVQVQSAASNGLSPSEIEEIPSFSYQRNRDDVKNSSGGNGGVGWLQCSVCIATVKEGETVRQLPVCKHVFHVNCIDKWLRSHSTCPMCRVDVKSGKLASDGQPALPV